MKLHGKTRGGRLARTVCLVMGMLFFFGCGSFELSDYLPTPRRPRSTPAEVNVHVTPGTNSILRVAIMPFNAPTDLIGVSVGDMLVTEVLSDGRYTLVERSQINRVLSETELSLSGISDTQAIEVGRMMGADGVIVGTVDEYEMVAHRGQTYPTVGLSVRLIDCTSGQVMWSVGHARQANLRGATLSGHARMVVQEAMAELSGHWLTQRQVRPDNLAPDFSWTAPPDNLRISDLGLREVTLTWNRSAEKGLTYYIERAEQADGVFTPIGEAKATEGSYIDRDGLGDGAVYYYRVLAVSRQGRTSEFSPVLESMTAPPPMSPRNLRAAAPSARMVRLTWTPSECPGVDKYIVERAVVPDEHFAAVGTVETASFEEGGTPRSPLQDSTSYGYRVVAVNRVGAVSPPSPPVEATMPPPPAPVRDLAAVSGEVRCVPLHWRPSPEEDVTGYLIYRATHEDGPYAQLAQVSGREQTEFVDGGGNPGSLGDQQSYYYRVQAINQVNSKSADSPAVRAATRPPPPPVAGLQAESGQPGRVTLGWQPTSDEKVVAYEIARACADNQFTVLERVEGWSATSFVDQNQQATPRHRARSSEPLRNGAEYTYRIRAVNVAGVVSEWSESVSAGTKPAPGAPVEVRAGDGRPGSVEVGWRGNQQPDIDFYVVEAGHHPTRGLVEIMRIERTPNNNYTINEDSLSPGLTRYYRVRAVDRDGLESEWSETVAGATKQQPEAPTDLRGSWDGQVATVTWRPPAQEDIVAYRVQERIRGNGRQWQAKKPELTLTGDQVGRRLVIMISAVDKDGLESAPSRPLDIRPPQ